ADLLFPPRCAICGTSTEKDGFCDNCLAQVSFIGSPMCPRCGLPYPVEDGVDHLCGDCLKGGQHFSVARSVGIYKDNILEIVHRFKYGRKLAAGRLLGSMMADRAEGLFKIREYDVLVPVPLHKERLRHRGFNQSLLLAREISGRFDLPVDFESLRRVRDTGPQASLGGNERRDNVRGAFEAALSVKGKKVLLIDDVLTTGSTVGECARALVGRGALEVAVYTAARAVSGWRGLRERDGKDIGQERSETENRCCEESREKGHIYERVF
ncbi:MAG: ComF family protein, partial [Syntrophaceae bacterium]